MTQTPPPQQVGFPPSSIQVNTVSGSLSRQIELWANQTLEFQQFLTSTPDATLEAPPFGYSADDVALLKSAFTDLALLANIYQGKADITPARDLGVFSRRLAGLVVGP